MKDSKIIKLWKSGLDKYKVAEKYRKEYNQQIKLVRLNPRHRQEKFLTKYESLEYVEKLILEELRRHK